MFSVICAWINGWVNNREAGDLRRRRAHYDVIVMWHNLRTLWKSRPLMYPLPSVIECNYQFNFQISSIMVSITEGYMRSRSDVQPLYFKMVSDISKLLEIYRIQWDVSQYNQIYLYTNQIKLVLNERWTTFRRSYGQHFSTLNISIIDSSLLVPHMCVSGSGQHWIR